MISNIGLANRRLQPLGHLSDLPLSLCVAETASKAAAFGGPM
jgi:hypothetical protein